jgi:group I intron endonuclease
MQITNSGIYKITNPLGRVYIGQSWNIKDRFRKYNYKSSQIFLMRSFEKYGKDKHKFEIIEFLDINSTQELMDEREIYWIDFYKKQKINLMNIRGGGSRGKHSEETKKKIGLVHKGNKYKLGYKNSEETRKKIAESRTGKKLSKESINKRLITIKSRKRTEKEILQFINFKIKSIKSIIKSIEKFDLNGNFIKQYVSIKEAATDNNLSCTAICNCLKNRSKSAGNFVWKYTQEKN